MEHGATFLPLGHHPPIYKLPIVLGNYIVVQAVLHANLETAVLAEGDVEILEVFEHGGCEAFEFDVSLMAVAVQILMDEPK